MGEWSMGEHERLARHFLMYGDEGSSKRIPESMYDMPAVLARWPLMLQYQADSGALRWRYFVLTHDIGLYEPRKYVATKQGHRANMVVIDKIRISAARLVWLLHYGEWPDGPLQRRDGDDFNDRIENLYLRSDRPKAVGRPRKRPVGVSRLRDVWQAYVDLPGGTRKYLGRNHKTEDDAAAARARWDSASDLA